MNVKFFKDLEYLSDNLEGRSNNPVAILFDALKQPDSDLGIDSPTCLSWKYEPFNEIDHLVIGKAPGPGGAWNDIEGSQLTISPCKWMELPNMSFSKWECENKQSQQNLNVNAGLVFSAKNSNFSEDKSLLNANKVPKNTRLDVSYNLSKYLKTLTPDDSSRASMHDVRNYYRDYVKQKNMDKYLLNNATVTSVRRICCNKLACMNKSFKKSNEEMTYSYSNRNDNPKLEDMWEVTGIIDKRDRKKASSLSHGKIEKTKINISNLAVIFINAFFLIGEIKEFRFVCKHLVLACGANDLYNNLNVKGENYRYILRSIRELEEKINENPEKFKIAPLLIVGAGLSAADAILLAKRHKIKMIHVIRRSVHDPNLVFKTLPKKSYPEYHEVYENMIKYRINTFNHKPYSEEANEQILRPILLNDVNNNNAKESVDQSDRLSLNSYENIPDYVLYDEHQVKYFTSKRSCQLIPIRDDSKQHSGARSTSSSNINRHLHMQKQHHNLHFQMKTHDEEVEASEVNQNQVSKFGTEIKICFACILIGYAPDLDFLPAEMIDSVANNPRKPLNTKDNPILIDSITHETVAVKNLYAMGPLIGDNFVRFGTGGALAITNKIVKDMVEEVKFRSSSMIQCPSTNIYEEMSVCPNTV